MDKINGNKDEHNVIKLGALLSQGILEVGGKNCILSLISNTGQNRIGAIVGIALFTQYYYWYPMVHFISLALSPQVHIGVDKELKIVKNFNLLSKSKPSLYGYPQEVKSEEKTEKQKTQAAVLSSTTRILAKKKSRLGTSNSINTDLQIDLEKSVSKTKDNFKPIEEEAENNKMIIDDANAKDPKPKEVVPEEPTETSLSNPCRILIKQRQFIEIPPDQAYEQVTPIIYSGVVVLRRIKEEEVPEAVQLVDAAPSTAGGQTKSDAYQPVSTAEIPDEFDIEITKG